MSNTQNADRAGRSTCGQTSDPEEKISVLPMYFCLGMGGLRPDISCLRLWNHYYDPQVLVKCKPQGTLDATDTP